MIVALIMLVMLTLMAVTASRFTMLGTRSSLSYQLDNTAFQAAEVGLSRGIEFIVSDEADNLLTSQGVATPSTSETISLQAGNFTNTVTYLITREDSIIDNGSSLGEGKSLPKIYRYVVDSTATVNDHNARSRLQQGYGALRFSE